MLHDKLLATGSQDPLLFIRYNPDTFHKNGLRQLVSGTDVNQADEAKKNREQVLVKTILSATFGEPASMQVLHMFYNCHCPLFPSPHSKHHYHVSLWLNSLYCNELRDMCKPIIV